MDDAARIPASAPKRLAFQELAGKASRAVTRLGPLRGRPTVLESSADPISKSELKSARRRRGSQGRVFATGNEAAHRAHSGNPAFRRPSISSFAFGSAPRAIEADIV